MFNVAFCQSKMEAFNAQAPAEGEAPLSSAEVVSKVLSQNSSNTSSFLKNIGIQPTTSTTEATAKERALQEELAAERQASAALREEVNALKEKSQRTDEALERTENKLLQTQRAMDENNVLLRRILLLNSGNLSLS